MYCHARARFLYDSKNQRRAFTLVELAIVLVIIGLVVGGIMVGRDMVESAQMRAVITQFERVETASKTFRLKYNCLAGDCKSASSYGLGTNGNGNDVFDDYGLRCLSPVANLSLVLLDCQPQFNRFYGEAQKFWAHLSAAGMVEGQMAEAPMIDPDTTVSAFVYLPKSVNNNIFQLFVMSWAQKTYVVGALQNNGPNDTLGFLKGRQVRSIVNKLGGSEIVDVTPNNPGCPGWNMCGAPTPLVQGAKFFVSSPFVSGGLYFPPFVNTVSSNTCAVLQGGNYVYRDLGECNLLWRIE